MTTPLVYTQGRRLALAAGAVSAHWLEGEPVFALADGVVAVVREANLHRIKAHEGAILCATPHPDGERLITGGDDGKLQIVSLGDDVEGLGDFGTKWVDHVLASAETDVIVAGVGKQAIVFSGGEESHRFAHPSTVGGLALDAKGRRLAVSHYGGVTLRYALDADDTGLSLAWGGSHLALTLSPDGAYVISAMQESALHGWKLPEKTDLRMTGYSAKTRSLSWDKRGRWLATSGADVAVVWPFVGKLGPQGKEPLLLAPQGALVSAVAFHPTQEMLAIGYANGAAMVVKFADQSIVELDELGEGAVTALAWSTDGDQIALGDEAGRGAIVKVG